MYSLHKGSVNSRTYIEFMRFNILNFIDSYNLLEYSPEIYRNYIDGSSSCFLLKCIDDISSDIFTKTSEDSLSVFFEFFNGVLLNRLRKRIPYFVETRGMLKCYFDDSYVVSDIICLDDMLKCCDGSSLYIVQEKLDGITLSEFLNGMNESEIPELYSIILQVCLAIQKSQEKFQFMHGALYPDNIILRKNDDGVGVSIFLDSQVFNVNSSLYIPTIIDFKSSRVSFKGFGVSYVCNPTIFTPGKDICKFVCSILAKVCNNFAVFEKVKWMNDFFHLFFDVKFGDDYDMLFERYNGFELSDDNPISNLSPIDFVNFFRVRNGELFNKYITIKPRYIKSIERLFNVDIESLDCYMSSTIKKYLYSDYVSTKSDVDFDSNLMYNYDKFVRGCNSDILNIYYNFPLKYAEKIHFDISSGKLKDLVVDNRFVQELYNVDKVISNYIRFLRYRVSVGSPLGLSDDKINFLFTLRRITKFNLFVVRTLPLYKLYKICMFIDFGDFDGSNKVLIDEYNDLLDIFKFQYPSCVKFISSIITPKIRLLESRFKTISEPLYYAPHTLQQFKNLYYYIPNELVTLVTKIFYGYNPEKEVVISRELSERSSEDDISVLLNLRKYYSPPEVSGRVDSRVKARVKEVGNILRNVDRSQFKTYLDFGGGDGSISYAIATNVLGIKDNIYSADIEYFLGRKVSKTYPGVTYIELKENQPIPLPDQSIDLVTCFQVLHHIKDVDFVLKELKRVCRNTLIIREHDCVNNFERMLIDFEHSIFEISTENPNVKILNDYEAWYRSRKEWDNLISRYGFTSIKNMFTSKPKYSPSKYYYELFTKSR